MNDLIDRQVVIDAIEHNAYRHTYIDQIIDVIKQTPSAQPEEQNARIFQGIIVEYPTISTYPECEGKPYFSIKYTEDGQNLIGYGTYNPDVLSEYLKKYFMPSAQPEPQWIPCSERLPEHTAIVTVETKTFKHKYVCEAVWIPRWTQKVEYDNWEDCSEYNEDEDEYYVLEGWYERVYNWDEYSCVGIEDDVIAWMPLPEPYQEATL